MFRIFERFIIVLIMLSFLLACVPINSLDLSLNRSEMPPVGEVKTVEVGASVLSEQDVQVVGGRKVEPSARGHLGLFPVDLEGMYVRANNGEHYCGVITHRDPLNFGKQRNVCLTDDEFKALGVSFVEAEDIVERPENLLRTLEYSGKSGSTVSLFYKEYKESAHGRFIRPAFTQEFKFDLAESSIIGVKGARIDVIEATNTGMTYKVIAHFSR